MAHEKILRQQKEREVQSNLDFLDRQGKEMDLLKALLAKLQKYERDLDQKHIPPAEQNKRNKEVCTEYKYLFTRLVRDTRGQSKYNESNLLLLSSF